MHSVMTLRNAMLGSVVALSTLVALPQAAPAADAVAHLRDTSGVNVGQVTLTQTPHGTLLELDLHGFLVGTHAFHVHETGKCIPPFTSAGGHFNPDNAGHGIMDDDGMHAGDMPNITVPPAESDAALGDLSQEVLNTRLELNDQLFDDDGAAIVIHGGADDYRTNPAGAAGARIACGVIER